MGGTQEAELDSPCIVSLRAQVTGTGEVCRRLPPPYTEIKGNRPLTVVAAYFYLLLVHSFLHIFPLWTSASDGRDLPRDGLSLMWPWSLGLSSQWRTAVPPSSPIIISSRDHQTRKQILARDGYKHCG